MEAWQGRSGSERTPVAMLHYAIEMGLYLYVRQCLEREPKVEDDTLCYVSPLTPTLSQHMTSKDRVALFTLVLEKGVDPNQFCPSGYTIAPTSFRETMWETFLVAFYNTNGGIAHLQNKELRPFAKPWISHGADIDTKVMIGAQKCDVRTCLLTQNGRWPDMVTRECEREVDGWLADARARRAMEPLASSSEMS